MLNNSIIFSNLPEMHLESKNYQEHNMARAFSSGKHVMMLFHII